MQDYTFIPSLGYTPSEFWSIANSFGFENRMDGLLAYMYTMIEECRKKGIRLSRDYLVSCGHAIELFPGVDVYKRQEQVSLDAIGEAEVLAAIRRAQPDTMSPIEAMQLLYELKQKLS